MSLRIMIHCIVTYTLHETSATPIADNDREILRDQVIVYVQGGQGKICWKDQNFCKAPLQTM